MSRHTMPTALLAELLGRLVIGMTEVGEKTGHEPEIFRSPARVLDRRVRTARSLRASLAWPAFQLGIAILVVGLLIFLAGVLRDAEGNPIDLLGFGLAGTSGVVIYALAAVAVGTGLWLGLGRALASWQSQGIVRRVLSRVPVLGAAARAAEAAGWSRAAGLAGGGWRDHPRDLPDLLELRGHDRRGRAGHLRSSPSSG
jgi:type II secretory pathway component PulF